MKDGVTLWRRLPLAVCKPRISPDICKHRNKWSFTQYGCARKCCQTFFTSTTARNNDVFKCLIPAAESTARNCPLCIRTVFCPRGRFNCSRSGLTAASWTLEKGLWPHVPQIVSFSFVEVVILDINDRSCSYQVLFCLVNATRVWLFELVQIVRSWVFLIARDLKLFDHNDIALRASKSSKIPGGMLSDDKTTVVRFWLVYSYIRLIDHNNILMHSKWQAVLSSERKVKRL